MSSERGFESPIFAITYMESRIFKPGFIEEDIIDNAEEMIEKFKLQYIADNKRYAGVKKVTTHETFASDMGYETDYKKALVKAKKEGKSLMIFMTTAYCPWCRKFENRILSQHKIDAGIKAKYVPVMLNLDKDTFPAQFAKSRFTPMIYIVDNKDEKIVHQFTGYSSREEFLHLLKQ